MKQRILAADVAGHSGSTVVVAGWVHRIRELGAVSFVLLRDRSGLVQLVYEGKTDLANESVVQVQGNVEANDKAPGGYEVRVTDTTVLAPSAADIPLAVNQDPESVGLDALLDNRILSLRMPKVRSIFTVQSTIAEVFASFLRSQDFTEIKSSKLIGTGTEGGTGLFAVDYFGERVYLAQSPQFYKQAMVASGMERVFEIGAAYRAEKHDTPRHLNEYVSLDVEVGFIDGYEDLMDLEARILTAIFAAVQDRHADILESFGTTVPSAEQVASIPRIGHEEAKTVISERSGKKAFEINPEGERILSAWAEETAGVAAVFVTEFPRKKRPFYTFPDDLKTRSFDLVFRGLEITTGSQRINEYAMLKDALPKFGLTEEGLADYVTIFKYGCPPHGGFAIGLERLTQQILGLSNVKEASLFPRDRRRVRP
ncbi:MAG: aspartate--tRNA(Asn) ligase [Spirochaetales bacterium]|nr:MAG: aspartate--tRNA(Asn) ligase [Spirochaetales bacterium]